MYDYIVIVQITCSLELKYVCFVYVKYNDILWVLSLRGHYTFFMTIMLNTNGITKQTVSRP